MRNYNTAVKRICLIGSHIRPFMENASRYGYTVTAIDGFNDWDSPSFGKVLGAKDGKAAEGHDFFRRYAEFGDVPVIFCSPVEFFADVLVEASVATTVFNASMSAISKCRDIEFLKNSCVDGIKFPVSGFFPPRPNIIKKFNSVGGAGVREDDGILLPGEYRQQLIDGISIGAVFYTSWGKTTLCGTTRHINEGYKFAGCVYPSGIAEKFYAPIEKFGKKIGAETGLAGWWGADFIITNESAWILEVNPRFTASLELIGKAHGIDIVEKQIRAFSPDICHIEIGKNSKYFGRLIVYAKESVVFKNPAKWFEAGMRDIPHDGELVQKGAPVLSIYADGNGYDECNKNLLSKKMELEKELYGD
jgi:predicted ATP-grasp superfamily ATP-dependent carboligase